MQPLGRKNIQLPGAKHHPKENGKNIPGWWEDIAQDSKTSARMEAKREIRKELEGAAEVVGNLF